MSNHIIEPASIDIETRLRGTRFSHIAQEFFTNTAHFPIVNIVYELLLEKKTVEYFKEPDLYILIIAALVQAYFLGSWQYKKIARPFWGNLIGPLGYTIIESAFEGPAKFFASHAHLAYWGFAFSMGTLQELRLHLTEKPARAVILLENVLRISIVFVMYGLFEAATSKNQPYTLTRFFADPSHDFIVIIVLLFGFLLGFSNITAQSYLTILRQTASQLRVYSEWLLGSSLLSTAVKDPSALALQRQKRTLLFMDIRGFTKWTEAQQPEEVVNMLNAYFEMAEEIWSDSSAIKVELTGDEVMLVFPTEEAAVKAAIELRRKVGVFLSTYNLSAGIGINSGPLIEGLLGSKEIKGYSVVGDTVNTAKRICDAAEGGEILISKSVYDAIGSGFAISEKRSITAKGKAEPLRIYSLACII